jgi:hypothetical protein
MSADLALYDELILPQLADLDLACLPADDPEDGS